MIVVDTNVIASYLLPVSEYSEQARNLLEVDRDWSAPLLWRSELGNVLSTNVRSGFISLEQARSLLGEADSLMQGGEFTVPSTSVLDLAAESGCTFYDCEFVALARELGLTLVTLDRQILEAFPNIAVPLADAIES